MVQGSISEPDRTAADVERAIRDEAPFRIDGREVVARNLDNEIGQAVHLVYLLNTEGRALEATDMPSSRH